LILPFRAAGQIDVDLPLDKRPQGAAPQSGSAPVRYTICDRSGNKQFAVKVCPFLPRPSEYPATPGTVARQIAFVSGVTTRTDPICETSRKNRLNP
jgi:hypothetical protein